MKQHAKHFLFTQHILKLNSIGVLKNKKKTKQTSCATMKELHLVQSLEDAKFRGCKVARLQGFNGSKLITVLRAYASFHFQTEY